MTRWRGSIVEPHSANFSFLILREMGVALINGLVGGVTWWLYDDPQLGGVMMLAMVLNLRVYRAIVNRLVVLVSGSDGSNMSTTTTTNTTPSN